MMETLLFVALAVLSVVGGTAAIAMVSSGRGALPPAVAGWPFAALLGVFACAGDALAPIFSTFYTLVALGLAGLGIAGASARRKQGSADAAPPVIVDALIAAVFCMPALGAIAVWAAASPMVALAAVCGVAAPTLAIAARLVHAEIDAAAGVIGAATAVIAVAVTIAVISGSDLAVSLTLALLAATTLAVCIIWLRDAGSVADAAESFTARTRAAGVVAVAGLCAFATCLLQPGDSPLVISAALATIAAILAARAWVGYDIARAVAASDSCDGVPAS